MVEGAGTVPRSKGVSESEPLPHSQGAGSRPQSQRVDGAGLAPAPDLTLILALLTLRLLSLPEDLLHTQAAQNRAA